MCALASRACVCASVRAWGVCDFSCVHACECACLVVNVEGRLQEPVFSCPLPSAVMAALRPCRRQPLTRAPSAPSAFSVDGIEGPAASAPAPGVCLCMLMQSIRDECVCYANRHAVQPFPTSSEAARSAILGNDCCCWIGF